MLRHYQCRSTTFGVNFKGHLASVLKLLFICQVFPLLAPQNYNWLVHVLKRWICEATEATKTICVKIINTASSDCVNICNCILIVVHFVQRKMTKCSSADCTKTTASSAIRDCCHCVTLPLISHCDIRSEF